MLRGIPWCHAISAIHFRKLHPIDYVAHWYRKETYQKTYSYFIQPVSNMQMWPQSTKLPVIPPEVRKLPGRPRKCRRKEQNENKTGKLSKKGVDMTCSLCHEKGHNKRSCHLNDQATTNRGKGRSRETCSGRSSVGSSMALNESEIATKRPPGQPRGSAKQASAATSVTEKGKGTADDAAVPGATRRGRQTPSKRPRMVGMRVLHT